MVAPLNVYDLNISRNILINRHDHITDQKMIEEAESLQKMQNMIQTKQYSKALEIALRLGRPGNAVDTLKLLSQDEIHALVNKLSNTNKFKLLEFWNGLQKFN